MLRHLVRAKHDADWGQRAFAAVAWSQSSPTWERGGHVQDPVVGSLVGSRVSGHHPWGPMTHLPPLRDSQGGRQDFTKMLVQS